MKDELRSWARPSTIIMISFDNGTPTPHSRAPVNSYQRNDRLMDTLLDQQIPTYRENTGDGRWITKNQFRQRAVWEATFHEMVNDSLLNLRISALPGTSTTDACCIYGPVMYLQTATTGS